VIDKVSPLETDTMCGPPWQELWNPFVSYDTFGYVKSLTFWRQNAEISQVCGKSQ